MKNAGKYNGNYEKLARIVNQINQRVRVLERMGYEVSSVSQDAQLYNNPERYEKLLNKYEKVMSPDYIDELHNKALSNMETNLKQMFGENVKVDLTPAQLKDFITKYPEYATLTKDSPEKHKQELQRIMDILGGTKEGILNAIDDVKKPKPQPVINKRPKYKKKRRKK